MNTPRTLKSALESGYVIKQIDAYGRGKQALVKLAPRFYKEGMKPQLSMWINKNYMTRNYPNAMQSARY